MQSICSAAAIVLALAGPTECATPDEHVNARFVGSEVTVVADVGRSWSAFKYGLPRMPRMPQLPRVPRVPKPRWP
jgi:hypothetical protein